MMTTATLTEKKVTTPPTGSMATMDKARAMAKRFRKQLDTLPPEWQDWVLGCVTFPTKDE
jgi:hypothetical protein